MKKTTEHREIVFKILTTFIPQINALFPMLQRNTNALYSGYNNESGFQLIDKLVSTTTCHLKGNVSVCPVVAGLN